MAANPGFHEPALAGAPLAGPLAATAPLPRRSRFDRYSRLLGMAKIVLPGAGLGILAVALLWQDLMPQAITRRVVPQVGLEQIRRHEMSSPKFVGLDEKNR